MDFRGHICDSIEDYKAKILIINELLKDVESFTSDSYSALDPEIFTVHDLPIIMTSNDDEINAIIEKNNIIFEEYNVYIIKINKINCVINQ